MLHNHAGWLMQFYSSDVQAATAACLQAPDEYIHVCLEGIGLMVSNPTWQGAFVTPDMHNQSFTENILSICQKFPPGYEDQCLGGAVDNLLNFDELDTQ